MDKTAIALEAISNETVDLENIPVEEVFEKLKCTRNGLSSDEVQQRLAVFGHNKLEEKKESKILKFLGFMWNPLSWVMEAAAIMAIFLAHGGVLRNGTWGEEDAAVLVPGDIVSIKLGDIIPADARLLEGDPLKIDQSALTGESLPVTKNPGDGVYSGSTCKQGEIEAVVIATGVHTFFGKAAYLVESTIHVGHFQKVLMAIGNFCICSIAIGMLIEIVVIYGIQKREYRVGIDNLLVLFIGGIPIAMPTVLSVTMAIGSHRLSQQGAITKRMTAIEEIAGMDVLCSDKTGTLTLNKLTVDKSMIEVFAKGVDKDMVLLMTARASRLENQDAIDGAIVSMLADPKEARAGITEVHFLPFNPTDKRTALTFLDSAGKMHRVSKGAPEQILSLARNKSDIEKKVHTIIDKFAKRGFRSLAVARQEVPAGTKEFWWPWEFVGLLPLFDPPRHDSAETIRRALDLGVSVKMITGDQLAIAKETGRRLGMGTNMHPSSSLLGENKDGTIGVLPIDELIENADGFAGVFPEHKFEIVKRLQAKKHIVGMTGDGVNDAPALQIADIGIAVTDSTDAARSASDIVLTEPGLSVIISAVLTSRAIFQRMKNYTTYAVSITIRIVMGFMLLTCFWKFNFPPFVVLIIAILNDDCNCNIAEATWDFAGISKIGWKWTGVIWLYNIVTYMLLDPIKFAVRYTLSGRAWGLVYNQRTAMTTQKDFGKEAREAAWAAEQRTLHGLRSMESNVFSEKHTFTDISIMVEEARRRAEIARLRELHTLKGKVEFFAKLKDLDIDVNPHHTAVIRFPVPESPFTFGPDENLEQGNGGSNRAILYLNVYDLTPVNNYLYWFGLGIFHSGIEVHGMEFGFGAHEYPTSGLTGKPIPGWVNRLARVGSFCNCLLPESIQITAVRHLPDHPAYSDEDGLESIASSVSAESEGEDADHHLLTIPNGDVAFLKEKPVRLARELL
ncbi:hypothetical protein GH714_030692 [Hevea brasiliensis]|uniref:Plasma membrane ATPase n=1 Tax=Hevea brasiliensis TaxID=3981 RepID=A0A6A6LGH3_HEVBR|nr:hypothetical protein GH714_030692 [Hevea brasiliensis]